MKPASDKNDHRRENATRDFDDEASLVVPASRAAKSPLVFFVDIPDDENAEAEKIEAAAQVQTPVTEVPQQPAVVVEVKPARQVEMKPVEVKPVEVKAVEVKAASVQPEPEPAPAPARQVEVKPVEVKAASVQSEPKPEPKPVPKAEAPVLGSEPAAASPLRSPGSGDPGKSPVSFDLSSQTLTHEQIQSTVREQYRQLQQVQQLEQSQQAQQALYAQRGEQAERARQMQTQREQQLQQSQQMQAERAQQMQQAQQMQAQRARQMQQAERARQEQQAQQARLAQQQQRVSQVQQSQQMQAQRMQQMQQAQQAQQNRRMHPYPQQQMPGQPYQHPYPQQQMPGQPYGHYPAQQVPPYQQQQHPSRQTAPYQQQGMQVYPQQQMQYTRSVEQQQRALRMQHAQQQAQQQARQQAEQAERARLLHLQQAQQMQQRQQDQQTGLVARIPQDGQFEQQQLSRLSLNDRVRALRSGAPMPDATPVAPQLAGSMVTLTHSPAATQDFQHSGAQTGSPLIDMFKQSGLPEIRANDLGTKPVPAVSVEPEPAAGRMFAATLKSDPVETEVVTDVFQTAGVALRELGPAEDESVAVTLEPEVEVARAPKLIEVEKTGEVAPAPVEIEQAAAKPEPEEIVPVVPLELEVKPDGFGDLEAPHLRPAQEAPNPTEMIAETSETEAPAALAPVLVEFPEDKGASGKTEAEAQKQSDEIVLVAASPEATPFTQAQPADEPETEKQTAKSKQKVEKEPKRKNKESKRKPKKPLKEMTRGEQLRHVILVALRDVAIVVVLFVILLQFFSPTVVNEHSMENTLKEKDILYIANQAYFFGEPNYNDIVIFNTPSEDGSEKKLVKRVIGLPGDTIFIANGTVYRNNEPLDEPYTKDGATGGSSATVTVPEDSYYVLGDNRAVSRDSRSSDIGFVTKDQLAGKVIFRFFPLDQFKVF